MNVKAFDLIAWRDFETGQHRIGMVDMVLVEEAGGPASMVDVQDVATVGAYAVERRFRRVPVHQIVAIWRPVPEAALWSRYV